MSKFKNLMSKIVIVFAMALMFGILGHGNVSAQGVDQYTKLLMHMDDNTFKDECGNVITNNNGVLLDSTIKKFGSNSGKFNGINSYLSLPSSNDFTFGSGDFTIDVWVYPNGNNSGDVISKGAHSSFSPFRIAMASGNWAFLSTTTGSSWDLTGNNGIQFGTVDVGVWQHLAICRSGSTIYMFKNGKLTNTLTTSSTLWNNSDPLNIGRIDYSTPVYFNGYIDELRISKGIARWTNDFTPPSASYSNDTKLTASASTTDTAITLNWDKVDGATGYNVKRSTTQGSGYTTIASNVTGTTYNDTTVQAGTTYYYVVTPIINGQEGTPSNEASATANKPTETGNAILTITMTNGNVKSYTVSMTKVNDFISWYNSRSSGSNGNPYYAFDKTDGLQPFTKKTEYIVFDKISSFEVDEYSK